MNWLQPINKKMHIKPEAIKICYVATIPDVIFSFMRSHIRAASKQWAVTIVSHPTDAELLSDLKATFLPLYIQRKVSLVRDLVVLFQLIGMFRRENFTLIHSIMPKTGLLSMLAGWLVGVPIRMHTFTGQVWANKSGWRRAGLKTFDRLIVKFATHILVDSPSQRDFLESEGVLKPGQGLVIGHGSICGIDAARFHPDPVIRQEVRAELNIGSADIIVLFLGRLNRDKGILDLAAAFAAIAVLHPEVKLLLVGAEENVPYHQVQAICGDYRQQLRRVLFTPKPERYLAAADIFCLPSYREGFGQVIIEAAACNVPTVASKIYGITDAVEPDKTGLLFPAGEIELLTQHLLKLIEDPLLRQQLGEAARIRTLALFTSDQITMTLVMLYETLLKNCAHQ